MSIRVLVVDDHPLMRDGLRFLINAQEDMEVVGEAADGAAALEEMQVLGPDVVIMDIGLPGIDGVEATRTIMSQSPTNIIVVTAYGDHRVQDALDSGARLVLTKPILEEQLAQAIEVVTGRKLDAAEGAPAAEGSNTCRE